MAESGIQAGRQPGSRWSLRPERRTIVLRLNAEVKRVLALPDAKQRFTDLGMSLGGGTPSELDIYIKSEIEKWSKVIKDADIRALD